MQTSKYEIVKEPPSTKHRFNIGQEVYIIHNARGVKAEIVQLQITISKFEDKKVVYVFNIRSQSGGPVGREEDVWETKKELIDSIFDL